MHHQWVEAAFLHATGTGPSLSDEVEQTFFPMVCGVLYDFGSRLTDHFRDAGQFIDLSHASPFGPLSKMYCLPHVRLSYCDSQRQPSRLRFQSGTRGSKDTGG